MENMTNLLKIFMTCEWKFDNSNTRELWSRLGEEDRKIFRFSMDNFDWSCYLKRYLRGIKIHILHEDPDNMKEALVKNRK